LAKRKVNLTAEEASAVVAMSSAGAAGLDQLEAEAVSVAVASAQQPRRSVARADPSEWDRAEAELASACRIISGLSTLMDELPGP
jgi:predicted DNA-binding transcriptional regulator YafY